MVDVPLLLINSPSTVTDCPLGMVSPTPLLIVNFFAEKEVEGEVRSVAMMAGLVITGPEPLFHSPAVAPAFGTHVTILLMLSFKLLYGPMPQIPPLTLSVVSSVPPYTGEPLPFWKREAT